MKHTLTMSKSTIAVIFALVATLTACHRQAPAPARQSESLYIDSIVNSHRNPDSLQTMLTAYKKTKNLLGVAVSHRALGRYYRDNSLFDIAIEHHRKSVEAAEQAGVEIRTYSVIYKAIEDIDAARIGMLKPTEEEVQTGTAEVRNTFKVPKVGIAAGCMVQEGEIAATDNARLVRDGVVVWEGKLASLRRYKDDVKSVKAGYECGIGLDGFQDIHVGDQIECYRIEEVARTE